MAASLLLRLCLCALLAAAAQVPLDSGDAATLLQLFAAWPVLRAEAASNAELDFVSALPRHCPVRTAHLECDSAGHLVRLTASNAALQGALPTELRRLTHLRHLDVSHNELSALFPLAPLSRLTLLDLSSNKFVAPLDVVVTGLSALQVLRAADNAFHDAIPDLSPLRELETLHLHKNSFTGPLPPSWPPALESCILSVQGTTDERSCFACPLPPALPPACTATPVFAVTCSFSCAGEARDDAAATRNYVFDSFPIDVGAAFALTRLAEPRFAKDAVLAPLTIDLYALPLKTLLRKHSDGSIGCVVPQYHDAPPIVRKLFQIAIVVRNNDLRRRFRIVSLELSEFRANAAVETAVVDVLRRVNGSQLSVEALASDQPPPLAIDHAEKVDRISVDATHASAGFAQLGATFGDAFVLSAGPFSSFRLKALKIESSSVLDTHLKLAKTSKPQKTTKTTTAKTTTTKTTTTKTKTKKTTTLAPTSTATEAVSATTIAETTAMALIEEPEAEEEAEPSRLRAIHVVFAVMVAVAVWLGRRTSE